MSMKLLPFVLASTLVVVHACKTPAGRTSSVSSDDEPSSEGNFFAAKDSCQSRMGFRLGADMSADEVDLTSYADIIEMHQGDVIKTLNGEAVTSPSQFESLCLEIGEKRPAMWSYGIERSGERARTLGGKPSYECDYLTLVGCGPLPKRVSQD